MFTFKVFLFLITICVVKSEEDFETMCKNDYRDEKNTQIDVLEYCSNKLCIEKCCAPGEMLFKNNERLRKTEVFKKAKKLPNAESRFNSINILSSLDVNKTSKKEVVFIYNNRNFLKCTFEETRANDYEISEDGSVWWRDSESKIWNQIEKLNYCIEYKFVKPGGIPDIKIAIWQNTMDPEESEEIEIFEIVALLISSFFLFLVLVVYCLIPDLRKLSDLLLMAYTFSLLFAFVNKLILTFISSRKVPPKGFCEQFSPVVYFAFMSSIFWLSAISFEVWWGLRCFRINRGSKHGELVKFMWCGLYAWGTPLLVTAIVTMLDNIVVNLSVKPPFKECLIRGKSLDYYVKIPIGILVFINIVLFAMIVYNLWMVKHAVNKCQESRSTKKQTYKFSTYAKLSVMMGLSWCLELLPDTDKLWFYILTNLYNLLTGVAIFYWFVCKKKILIQLCNRFNIRNDFTKKLESLFSVHNKSEITRTTEASSSIVKNRSKDQNPEMDLLKNSPNEESTIV